MRLNRSTSHAIRILVDCARADGRLVKVADIAQRLALTDQNVFKIVHLLSRAELLAAVRGRNGGVRLAREARTIRIGDVVRAMETTDLELEGEATTRADRTVSEGVNKVLDSALDAFISILDQHTLADLVADGRASSMARPVAPDTPALEVKTLREGRTSSALRRPRAS
jgi:Rrf2 family nitric oxide-sensitive transcriptional repressor